MRLVKLSVQRFQCIESAEVDFGPGLNVLYGPNDLGKSSLAWAIRAALLLPHGATLHEHVHVRRGPRWMRRLGHGHAAFAVGVLHGVAGSSHFFGVLPALALPTAAASFGYIGAFGLGTVAAMTAFAGAIGGLDARGFALSHHRLMAGTGIAAIVVGCVWIAGAIS